MHSTHAKLHELLWDVSYYAMAEQLQMRHFIHELDSDGNLRPANMPEEATTINLVRRLSILGSRTGVRVQALLHTRALEGGFRSRLTGKQVRLPSGADLQLAVRTPSGWGNFLLQAKRLYPAVSAGGASLYKSWSSKQNAHLTRWAAAHGQTPGMLLYNDLRIPFVAREPPRGSVPQGGACDAFGACAGANQIQLHPYSTMNSRGLDVFAGTPAGVGVCLDPQLLAVDRPTAATVAPHQFPLEHLAHGFAAPARRLKWWLSGAGGQSDGPLDWPQWEGGGFEPQAEAPAWAARLLRLGSALESQSLSEDEEFQVPVSVVIFAE